MKKTITIVFLLLSFLSFSAYVDNGVDIELLTKNRSTSDKGNKHYLASHKNTYSSWTSIYDTSKNPQDYVKVTETIKDKSILWNITFFSTPEAWDRPHFAIFLSNNLNIIDGTYKMTKISPSIEKDYSRGLELVDSSETYGYMLHNNLSEDEKSDIGDGLFKMVAGKSYSEELNRFGRQLGQSKYFRSNYTSFVSHPTFTVEFETNKIDAEDLNIDEVRRYFVAAMIKNTPVSTIYEYADLLEHTYSKNLDPLQSFVVKNDVILPDSENFVINMKLTKDSKTVTSNISYTNVTDNNNQFQTSYLLSSGTLDQNMFEYTTNDNYVIHKGVLTKDSTKTIQNIKTYSLGVFNNLNNNQNEYYKNELKNKAINDLQSDFETLKASAKALNQTMKLLRQEEEKKNIKNTSVYINSTTSKKDLYDQKLQETQELFSVNGENKDHSYVVSLLDELTNARESLDGVDTLLTPRNEAFSKLKELQNINDNQKIYYNTLISGASEELEINKVLEDAQKLDNKMKDLLYKIEQVKDIKTKKVYTNNNSNEKVYFDNYFSDATLLTDKASGENKDYNYVEELIKNLEKAYYELLATNLKDYENLAKRLYNVNTNIINNFDKDYFFNINLGTSFKDLLNSSSIKLNTVVSNFNLGLNYKVLENLRVGGFLEYDRINKLDELSLGFSLNYINKKHNLKNFLRYRVILGNNDIKEDERYLVVHNLDLLVKYKYKEDFGNFSIMPAFGFLFTVQPEAYLGNSVKFKTRFTTYLDTDLNIDYKITPKNKVYFRQNFLIGINRRQYLFSENKTNQYVVNNDFIETLTTLGYEYQEGMFKINADLSVDSRSIFRTNFGFSYTR